MTTALAGTGMPTRKFSALILAGLWPTTPASVWSDCADADRAKANELFDNGQALRKLAGELTSENAGKLVEAMHESYMVQAVDLGKHGDAFMRLARADQEAASIIEGAKADLDAIDARAHDEIERILASSKDRAVVMPAINQVIAMARAQATAKTASVSSLLCKSFPLMLSFGVFYRWGSMRSG